eukprot:CAMPEP_0168540244 /NCGR_PEP_ID=MMETSP0413-20121227/169_1 /TAXON_ID=136452 /ORGANISM="Filamoeba nolandi, Strain NC-AS-23-1" /LENGTH=213 /DNA_ID=CAMNT_0008569957 /DNA_START=162 /DNA_END=799 /DNA_ORIENTATION=+
MQKNKTFQYSPQLKYFLMDLQNRLHIAQNKKGAAPSGSWISLPSIGSLFNKGISKLIGTEDEQNGAPGPQPGIQQPMAYPTHARTGSSGNILNTMPFPPAAMPAPPAATSSPQPSPRRNNDDDLGFGNNSFSTPKKSNSEPDTSSPSKDKDQAQSQASITTRLSGFFSPLWRRGGPPVADLGQENQFEYNKELGMWLKKGEKPDPAVIARKQA